MNLALGLLASALLLISEQSAAYGTIESFSQRQAELSRENSHIGRGRLRPDRPNRPNRPNPGRPGDRFDGLYGPARTVSWIDQGVHRAPKLIEKNLDFNLYGQYVNEVIFRALGNEISIERAYVRLVNGQVVELHQARTMIRKNNEARLYVDDRYSLAIQSLHLVMSSPDLIGSRGQLQVLVGIAR